jgi:hypothetical protein
MLVAARTRWLSAPYGDQVRRPPSSRSMPLNA